MQKEGCADPFLSLLGNANLIYTVIRKRKIFSDLSNLSPDGHSPRKTSTLFQTEPKSSGVNEPLLTDETSLEAVTTTLAETPCQWRSEVADLTCSFSS